ncbi:manganese-dependent inorganic pyrophosphatase [Motiliproteus sp. SC1-56]|uniref:manganese-dependent inorganic pyrophosphatase n=1 Tax=Motiliproteus sp. SC1-56 TaxID=2799565 RepID=UPI001A8CB577|nr:manganese-dependent inorganic pyrophosphatase [Motiliproteus sp. SC1-56]
MTAYVLGHKIPDSDSICAALALAHLKNAIGEPAVAVRQGELNPETAYILDKFGLEAPVLKTQFADESVYLVDHSDRAQSPDDLDKATVLGIVDHHKLGDITTSAPLECWIRPVGCTNTIIKEMFEYYGVEIPRNIAGIMMSAILSDTVIFKSPTCTELDIKAVKQLAEIAGVGDYEQFGIEMFKVKSDVQGTPVRELVLRDFKDFDMSGRTVGIGQLETVDLSVFDTIKEKLLADIETLRVEGNRHSVCLLLTDIMNEGSELLVASDAPAFIEEAFGVTLKDGKAWLPGVLSRKKQVVPPLEKRFA